MDRFNPKLVKASLIILGAFALEFPACAAAVAIDDAKATDSSDDDFGAITPRTNMVLQLEVVINGQPTGKIGQFVIRAGQPFARPQDLRGFGIRVPSTPGDDQSLVGLNDLGGMAVRIDQPGQTIFIDATDERLLPNILGERSAPEAFTIESGTGATLNYDLVGTAVSGHESVSGVADLRAFSRLGVISSDVLFHTNSGFDRHGNGGFEAIRLDTTYVHSDPRSLRRYRAGDFISGSLPWTRPVRMGGAQINLDFSMRPDLITFPVPSISGSAAVPSTVDVLVNGSTVRSGSVAPGPFEVPQVPVISGAGTVTTTVTDALGRQVTTELPFYASPTLLAPKLQTYSAEIGLVRRDWGTESNDYGALAGAITYRRGLSSHLTFEGHAEYTEGLLMGGVGGNLNLGNVALARLAVAGSSRSGRTGGQLAAGLERTTPHYHLGIAAIFASHDFADIAALNDDPIPTRQLSANAGIYLARIGSLGIAFTEVKRESAIRNHDVAGDALAVDSRSFFPQHSKLLTASYSRPVGFGSFYATAFRDFSHDNRTTALVGLTIPLGSRTSANISAQATEGSRSGQVEVSRTAIVPGDWGFRFFAAGAQHHSNIESHEQFFSDHEFGQVTYKANFGEFTAGFDRTDGQTIFQGQASGAVSFIDGALFASNRIDDSFAVVDTGGMPGIRVRQENRDVGRTDSRGRFLVPDLRSFEVNQLSIEPLDAPITADVPLTEREVRPQDRSGVVVWLPVINKRSALVRLVDAGGKPIRVGSAATLSSSGVAVPVGYDGEAYLVDLQDRNEVIVEQPDRRRCVVTFDYQDVAGEMQVLGPLPCKGQTP
jgi:outer membrane usher protein